MSEQPTVLIITRDPEVAALAESLRLGGIDSRLARDYMEAQRNAESPGSWVALLDCELPQDESFQAYRLLHTVHRIPTLLLVPGSSYWQFALDPRRSLTDDCVSKPARLDELIFRLKAMILRAGFDLPNPVASGSEDLSSGQKSALHSGQIVCLFSVKGGVGKSTIAVNVGVGLSKLLGLSTLIVDADLWFGDVGILMNMSSRNSLSDLCGKDEPDIAALRETLVQHESGASVLLRPWDVTVVEKLDINRVAKILRTYQTMFDFVVVDMQPSLDELNLQILDVADKILLVITPEISAAANTYRFMEISDSLGYTSKISIIINRSNYGIGIDHIQAGLKTQIAGTVVSAGPVVVNAATKGASLFTVDPDHREQITQDMTRIVELVSGQQLEQPKAHKGKWLRLRA